MLDTGSHLDEQDRIERWRLREFLRLGFPVPDAEELAESDAVLRDVEQLLRNGCSHATALRISL